jgi:glycosyltransferase involved in cell wall biosynthesis
MLSHVTTVGIIVPTHGAGAHLAETIETVRAQTFNEWTLVIVCDGAGECGAIAEALTRTDPRVRMVRQPHAGVAAARNRGLVEIGHAVEMIAFLDHDDRWLPHSLDLLVRTLANASPGIVGVHGLGRYIDGSGHLIRHGEMEMYQRQRHGVDDGRLVEWPRGRPTTFANLVFSNCIPVGSVLVRREAFDRVGAFDLRAVPADDYDMWLRLSRIGGFEFVDDVVMEYRRNVSPTWVRPRAGVSYMRRKSLSAPENTPAQAALARQGYRLCARWTAAHELREAARLASERRFGGAAKMLVRAALNATAYVRGAPVWA